MAPRKARKTYTLDPDLVTYVETVRKERSAGSSSSALEEILRESKLRHERERVEHSIAAYYSSLSEEDRDEERAWGEFSESQFPKE